MFPAWIKKYLEHLTPNKKFGVCQGSCYINGYKSGSSLTKKTSPSDRCVIQLPYASDVIDWFVIFDHSQPDFPPDFIFDCLNFEPSDEEMQCLFDWDPRDPLALTHVLAELYAAYAAYQVRLLSQYPRLQTIYDNILQVIDTKNIEVHLPFHDKKSQELPAVVFAISIEGPFHKIPSHMFNGVEGSDLVLLKLTYAYPDASTKPIDSISISPRLSQAFGQGIQFPGLYNSNVARYIVELKEFLTERMEMLDNGVSKRQSYIEALTTEFTGGMVEVDTSEYLTASVLINFLDFHFILQVTMPTYFPKEQPKLTFRSVYHTDESDRPFSKHVRVYPWSPRWSSEEMIRRLQTFVSEVVPNFQRASVMEGTALKPTAVQPPADYDEVQNN